MNLLSNRILYLQDETGWINAEIARKAGVERATVTEWIKGKTKHMSAEVAQKLSMESGFSSDWLATGKGPKRITSQELKKEHEEFMIPRFDAGARMGDSGYVMDGYVGVIENLKVDAEWLRNNLKGYTSTSNLGMVTGFGESMKPLFNPGDPLIVDLSIREFIGDFPYLFRIGNELFIKRIQRVPGSGFIALSDNKNYRDWPITQDMDFAIIGKVIKIWCSEDF